MSYKAYQHIADLQDPNTNLTTLDRYYINQSIQNGQISPDDKIHLDFKLEDEAVEQGQAIFDSQEDHFSYASQKADIIGFANYAGITEMEATKLFENTDILSHFAKDRITEKPSALEALYYGYKSNVQGRKTGEAFSKYMLTGDDKYIQIADDFYEKSKQFNPGDKGYGWLGDLAVAGAKQVGSTSKIMLGDLLITGGSNLLFSYFGLPAVGKAVGTALSSLYTVGQSGMEQAGLDMYEISKMTDSEGNKIDMNSSLAKTVFALDLLINGTIEVVGLNLMPGYKNIKNFVGGRVLNNSVKQTIGSFLKEYATGYGFSILDESSEELMQQLVSDSLYNALVKAENEKGKSFDIKSKDEIIKNMATSFVQAAKSMSLYGGLLQGVGMGAKNLNIATSANKNQSGEHDSIVDRSLIAQPLPEEVTAPLKAEQKMKAMQEKKEGEMEEKTEEEDLSSIKNDDGKYKTVNIINTPNGGIPASAEDVKIIQELDKQNKNRSYGLRANVIGQKKSKMQADQITSIGYAVDAKVDNQGNLAFDNQEDYEIAKKYVEENLFITNRKEEDGQINYTAIDEAGSRVEFSFRMAQEGEKLSSISGVTDKMPTAPSVLASDEKFFADAEKKLVSDYIISKNPKMSGDTLKSSTNALITLFNTLGLNTDEALGKNLDLVLSDAPAEHLGAKGWFKREETSFNPDGSKKFTIHITKNADPTTLVHESWHLLSYALGPETMNSFANAYNGKTGEMWVSDIKKTPEGKYQLGSKTFDTYNEAFEQVRGFEERLAEDAEKFFKNGVAPTEETRNIFQKLLDFIRKLVSQHSEDLSAETVKAFRQVLGQARPTTETGIAGEALYQENKSFTETESMLKADPKRFNEKGEHLAPNGEKSNLDYNLWVRVHTPEFKNWFGDWENDPQNASKVVDENGEPLVVYHGTRTGGFAEFDEQEVGGSSSNATEGFFFTDNKQMAVTYSNNYDYIKVQEDLGELDEEGFEIELDEQTGIYPVFLNIREVNIWDYEGRNWDGEKTEFYEEEEAKEVSEDEEYEDYFPPVPELAQEEFEFENDGLIVENVIDEGPYGGGYTSPSNVYVAFKSNQIKSIENVGTFSPDTANILYQEDKTPLYQLSEEYKAKISQDTSEQVRKVLEAKTSFVPDYLLEKHVDKPWAREEIKFRRQAKMLTSKEQEFILSFDSLEEYIEKARASQELEVTDQKLIEQDNKNLERLYTYFQLKNKTPEKLDSDFSEKIKAMSDAELIEFGKNLNRGVIGKSRTGGTKGIIKTGATAVSLAGVSPKVLRLSETSTAEEITTAKNLILENPKYYRWAEQKLSEAEKKATGEVIEQEIFLDQEAREDFYREMAEKKESLAEKIKAEKINKEFRQATLDELESKLLDDRELLEKGKLKDEDISSIKSDIAVAEEKISQAKKEIEKLNSQIKELKKNEKANEQIIRDLEEAVSQYKAVLAQSGAEKLDLQTKLEETTKKYEALERSKKIREAREARENLIKKIKNRSVLNNLTLDASYASHLDFIHSLFNKKNRSEVNQEISELIQDQKTAKLFGNKYKVGKIQEELNSLRALRDSSDIIEIPDELKPFFSDELKSKITAIKQDNRQSKWTIDELTQILNVLENVRDTAKNSLLKKKAERTEILNASMTNFVKQHANNKLDPKSEENIKALNKFVDYNFADYDNRPKNVIKKFKDVVGSLYRGYAAQGIGVSRWLDGWQEGVLFDYMNRKALRNENAQLKNSHERWQVLDNYLKEHKYGHKNLHKNFITYSSPTGDTTINLGEAIGVYCFSKNGEEAMIKLKSQAGNQMSEETIEEIINKLSDEDKALGDFLIETIGGDEIWNRLSERYLEVYNRNLGRRENYMTFVPKNTIAKSDDEFATDFLVNANGTPVKYTEKGMTKQINPQAVYRLDLDVVNIVYSQIKRQEHFLAWCEWSRDMNYMLNSTMGRTIRRIYGTDALQTLQNLVNQYVAPNEVLVKWEKYVNKFVGNTAVGILGFNPSSAMTQFASLSATIRGDITLKGFTETLTYITSHPAKAIKFVNEKSPFMRDRTLAIAVADYKKYAERGQLSTFVGQVNEKYAMKMIEFNDNIVASTVWLARYKTAIEKEGASVEEAIFQADMTVRETQSSSNVLDRSKAQATKNPLVKILLLFTNDAFKMANQIAFGLPYYWKQKNWKKLIGTSLSIILQAVLVTAIHGALFKRKGDDDDDEKRKDRIILALLGQFADDLIPVAGRLIEGGISGFTSTSPVAEPLKDIGELARKLVRSEGTEEDIESINRTLINTAFDIGTVSALPVVESKRVVKAIKNKNAWELLGTNYADLFADEEEWDF